MRQITEVLRLNAQGLSYRQIAPERRHQRVDGAELPRTRTARWAELAAARRPGRGCPRGAAVHARRKRSIRPGRPEPNWLEVHRERKRGKHVTLQLLHLEYKAVPSRTVGAIPSSARTTAAGWARQDVVMRLEYAAGERMFVDFAGDTVPVTDPETGEIWNAQVFVSVLGASGYLYVEATRSQDLASWLGAHVEALEFYGGSRTRRRARQPEVGRDQSVLV